MPTYKGDPSLNAQDIIEVIEQTSETTLVAAVLNDPVGMVRRAYNLAFRVRELEAENAHLRAAKTTPEDVQRIMDRLSGGYKTGLEATPANIRMGSKF